MKCDRCPAASAVAYVNPSRSGRVELCKEHARVHDRALVERGWARVVRVNA